MLAAAEKTFGELTGTLADLTARRNQLQAAIDSQGERRKRLDDEIAGVEAELAQLGASTAGRPDLVELSQAADAAQAAVAEAEAAARARRGRAFRRAPGARRGARVRWPRPSAARNGSTPKRRRWPSSCTSTPRASGRR